jgi:hypothetical protein
MYAAQLKKGFFYYGSLKICWADGRICGLPRQIHKKGLQRKGTSKSIWTVSLLLLRVYCSTIPIENTPRLKVQRQWIALYHLPITILLGRSGKGRHFPKIQIF